MLGGEPEREREAAEIVATRFRDVPTWVTGPADKANCVGVFIDQGVEADLLRVDLQAVDTVSNFTSLATDIKRGGFKAVVIITSKNHMRRASHVGRIILESYGVQQVTRVAIFQPESIDPPESYLRELRDQFRAEVFVQFGFDPLYFLNYIIHPDRIKERESNVENYSYVGAHSTYKRLKTRKTTAE